MHFESFLTGLAIITLLLQQVYFDIRRLSLLKGKCKDSPRDYLFVGIDEGPYTVECAYSDNGKEYKGTSFHAFVAACAAYGIAQSITRVIKTLLEMWHEKTIFELRQDRHTSLARFINFYNTVKPHAGIDNMPPYEKLNEFFKT